MRKTKFYKRILIFQLIVVLFYTIVFSAVIYFQNNSLINENFENKNNLTVDQLAVRADSIFKESDEVLKSFYANEYLIKFSGGTEDFYNVKQLCEALQKIGYREKFNLCFMSDAEELVATPDGTISFFYFLEMNGFDNVGFDEIKGNFGANTSDNAVYLDSEKNILEIKPFAIGRGLVWSIRMYNKGELFPLLENDGISVEVKKGNTLVSLVGKAEDIKGLPAYTRISDSRPFEYTFSVSRGGITDILKKAFARALVMCILLELIGLVIINFSTKKIYSPIERMLNAIATIPMICAAVSIKPFSSRRTPQCRGDFCKARRSQDRSR